MADSKFTNDDVIRLLLTEGNDAAMHQASALCSLMVSIKQLENRGVMTPTISQILEHARERIDDLLIDQPIPVIRDLFDPEPTLFYEDGMPG